MALYLKIDNLQGDVTNKAYKGYSQISTMHLPSISNGNTNITGRNDYHRGNAPQFAPIHMIKPVDSISPYLLSAACDGRVFKKVTIIDTSSNGDSKEIPYIETTLTNVRIADYAKSHHGEGVHPREMLSLTYSSISEKLSGKNGDGSPKASQAMGYDLEAVKAL